MAYTPNLRIQYADSPNLDAFGRLRTSGMRIEFHNTFQYTKRPLMFEESTSGGATVTHLPNEGSVQLQTAASAASTAIMQSRQYFRYVPGQSLLVQMTGTFGAETTGVIKRIGYFDANNGFFFQQRTGAGDGTTGFFVTKRSYVTGSAVDTEVEQANWNLDKLDGSGASGLTLDLTKVQIMVIDAQYLGAGRVRMGFNINGTTVYCHQFLHANLLGTLYAPTLNLPVRYEIVHSASLTAADTIKAGCQSVALEDGCENYPMETYAAGMLASPVTAASGVRTAVFAIRLKSTFNSIVNRGLLVPHSWSLLGGANPVFIELLYMPNSGSGAGGSNVLTGGWTSAHANSLVEYTIPTGIGSGVGEVVLGSGFAGTNGAASREAISSEIGFTIPLGLPIAGTANTQPALVLCAAGLGGTSVSYGGFEWHEVK